MRAFNKGMRTLTALALAAVCTALVSCERKTGATDSSDQQIPSSEIAEPAPPAASPVTQPEDFKVAEEEPGNPESPSPTPGQRLDHAIEKTQEGLETAKEKTQDGLETAKEKTEEGLRKAAEKTGGFLQRTGEAIERKASGQ